MSLPNYKNWKKENVTESYAGSSSPEMPYMPSTEKGLVGNQLRTPEAMERITPSREHDTAPSMQNGGPVRSDTSGWHQDILKKFQNNIRSQVPATPENTKNLGDMGMQNIGSSTFGKSNDPIQVGSTPLLSGGVPVTPDSQGQFENFQNPSAPPIQINPASEPDDPNVPGQTMAIANKLLKSLRGKSPMVIQQVKQFMNQGLMGIQQERLGGGSKRFARQDIKNARSGMNNPVS